MSMQSTINQKAVTIVVPIYGDLPSLKECLDSLGNYVDTSRHVVMLVNDCGPEADKIEQYIQENIVASEGFIYYRNDKNLGFVGTCNRAVLELDDTDNDILLLNSDTKVTEGFLEEMLAVLYAEDDIGAVSPRSNNATIATVPLYAAKQKGINPTRSYKIFERIKPKMARYTIAPVAHGFCMLIRRSVIGEYGLFDPVFGKGYGEEVDFCMRIKKHGYKSALSNKSYVFHQEAKSFTLETKTKLLEENNKIIRQRYPEYGGLVSEYMKNALNRENNILKEANIPLYLNSDNYLKRLIKSNRLLYKLARYIKSRG